MGGPGGGRQRPQARQPGGRSPTCTAEPYDAGMDRSTGSFVARGGVTIFTRSWRPAAATEVLLAEAGSDANQHGHCQVVFRAEPVVRTSSGGSDELGVGHAVPKGTS